MTPQDLKNSILQLAIQGKLVEQRVEEGTAEELYQQIQVEKQKLIKEGKIKKEKPLPEITEDEKPFDIPESWKWVRLNEIVGKTIKRGKSPKYTDKSNILVFAQKCNVKTGGINMELAQYLDVSVISKYPDEEIMCDKDIVINSTGTGTMGRVGIYMDSDNPKGYIVVPDSHVTVIRSSMLVEPKYIFYFAKYSQKFLESMGEGSTNQKELKADTIKALTMPLPPLEEQKRIVAKIEELLPSVDQYGIAYNKLEAFNKRFPDDMRKSILQMAIRGKLVEQRAEEGTAEELYQKIQAEKQKLIKEGKIKKEKPLPEIAEDEIPFDIPESWKWVRLNDIVGKTIKRGKSPKYTDKSNILVFAQKCNVKTGGINMELAKYLDASVISKYPDEEIMCDKDIVINSTGTGTMGRVGIYMDSDNPKGYIVVPDSHVTVIRSSMLVEPKYIFCFAKYSQKFLESMGEGSTNQKELKADTIKALTMPLPPLEEQKRIVAKIEELLLYCEQLQ